MHDHGPTNFTRAFAWGIALNSGYIVAEVTFGIMAGSLALLADAGHNMSDVLGLGLSWMAHRLASSTPTVRRTYGLRRVSILAALGNALLLLVAVGAIAWEAVERLRHPQPALGSTMMWVAAAGVLVNAATAWLFASGRKGDLNIRSAFLHMAADAGVSLGVVLAGLAIRWTGLSWIDPAVSLLVAGVILVGTWGLLRDSVALSVDTVPREIDAEQVLAYLRTLPGVEQVHDLHIWPLGTTTVALTAHLVRKEAEGDDELLQRVQRELHDTFDIEHATLQIEHAGFPCRRGDEHLRG